MMKKQISKTDWLNRILIVVLAALMASASQAEDKFSFSDRAKKREGSRWTLSEWLAMKERNKMMDMWLSMNAPSPYEFSLLGANTNFKKTGLNSSAEYTTTTLEASAYAKIFGLSVEYENRSAENQNDLSGLFNFRLLGHSIQSTSLTLHYGQRTRTFNASGPSQVTRNQFYQVSLQIYLSQYFGLNGYHRNFLPFNDPVFGDITGTLNQGGAFIDFEYLRVFGAWFEDIQKNSSPAATDPELKRTGIKAGLQLFF